MWTGTTGSCGSDASTTPAEADWSSSRPKAADLGPGLTALLNRVEQGIIEILDIELIGRDDAGAPIKRAFADLDGVTGIDVATFDGVESGILDGDDLESIASELQPGQIALAVVYEDRSLAMAADAWTAIGGVELFSGGIDIEELDRALNEGNQS
ncbi:hypothetical protein LEUCIP111803_02578 [Leucobacter soli]|uniref:Uncharacterized protein n=1 Tax=Leucobacter soli TaxID=2812850 RepID=A0A916K0S8_9MICO|nr:hypothetical protein LEUCIP111803_02578 [Leucobacter soli]